MNADQLYNNLVREVLSFGNRRQDRTGVGTLSIPGSLMRFNLQNGFPLLNGKKIHTSSVLHELLWFLGSFDEEYKQFGNTNIKYLVDHGVSIWDEWPHKHYVNITDKHITLPEFRDLIKTDDEFAMRWGKLGPVYGKQWIDWGGTKDIKIGPSRDDNGYLVKTYQEKNGLNQIDKVIKSLKENPFGRRHIVSAWNASEIDLALLPPCHILFQFHVSQLSEKRIEEINKGRAGPKITMSLSMTMYQR